MDARFRGHDETDGVCNRTEGAGPTELTNKTEQTGWAGITGPAELVGWTVGDGGTGKHDGRDGHDGGLGLEDFLGCL